MLEWRLIREGGFAFLPTGGDKCVVYAYHGHDEVVVVPEKIGKYFVEGICSMAFDEYIPAKEIYLPDTLQFVSPGFIWRCRNLLRVYFGLGPKKLPAGAIIYKNPLLVCLPGEIIEMEPAAICGNHFPQSREPLLLTYK